MGDPVSISSYLVDLLDDVYVLTFVDIEHPEDTTLFEILDRLIEDSRHERMEQPVSRVSYIRSGSFPDNRLECGEKDENGEVVQVLQAQVGVSDDVPGLNAPEPFVFADRALPREVVPVSAPDPAEEV